MTSGDFTIEDDSIVMAGASDGTTVLQIEKENGKIILCYYGSDGTLLRTYYDNAEEAASVREARQEVERIAAEEKKAAELELLKNSIIGYWCDYNYAKSFAEDGTYVEYTSDGPKKGTYEILKAENEFAKNRISVTKADGTTTIWLPELQENGTYSLPSCTKAIPVPLTAELLLGKWYDAWNDDENPSMEFFENGTYAIKSAFPEFVADTILNYSISGENTFNASSDSSDTSLDTRWAYLSKSETGYQLYWSFTQNTFGERFTSLNYFMRPFTE